MSSSFDQMLIDDADLMITEMGGEDVVYKPKVGEARTIKAIVDRAVPSAVDQYQPTAKPLMRVTVSRGATTGIPGPINFGGDTITVVYQLGGTAKAYLIHPCQHQDPGCFHFELR